MKKLKVRDTGNQSLRTRGQSYFRNVQFSWMYTYDYGLSIAHMRCGVCLLPLESMALRLGDRIFLLCEEGHLVGTEINPHHAEEEWMQIKANYENEVRERKRKHVQEYKRLLAELAAGLITEDELRAWENDVPSYTLLPQYTKAHEYNQKLEEISKLFKDSYFQRGQRK